jgi:hypothetical protein
MLLFLLLIEVRSFTLLIMLPLFVIITKGIIIMTELITIIIQLLVIIIL